MKIEHIVYLTPEEWEKMIKVSGSKNKKEMKEFIKKEYEMQSDFCVRIRPDNDGFNMRVIDYGEVDEE